VKENGHWEIRTAEPQDKLNQNRNKIGQWFFSSLSDCIIEMKSRSADRRTDLARGVEKLKIDPSTC